MGVAAPPGLRSIVAANVGAVADAVRAARADHTALRLAGRGTWLDAGRPVTAEAVLDLSGLSGIVEYVPGDLTLTAYAGTTLAEIADATRAHGQWLALDPFGAASGTLGATLATASAGPLAPGLGSPRDVTIGLAFVSGEGKVVHGGGRVVKNVAGFDLVRLTIGAWGTLGPIVQASVRLRALPDADETVAVALPEDVGELRSMLARVRAAPLAPLAAELVSPALATLLGLSEADHLLLRLAGNAQAVAAQRAELSGLGALVPAAPDTWTRLRGAEPAACSVVRLSRRPSELARLWSVARRLVARPGGAAHATLERGVVRCWLPTEAAIDLPGVHASFDSDDVMIFERLPAPLWPTLARSGLDDRVSRAIRAAFDPAHIMNPGILGERAP